MNRSPPALKEKHANPQSGLNMSHLSMQQHKSKDASIRKQFKLKTNEDKYMEMETECSVVPFKRKFISLIIIIIIINTIR